jgi:hypothetical protein
MYGLPADPGVFDNFPDSIELGRDGALGPASHGGRAGRGGSVVRIAEFRRFPHLPRFTCLTHGTLTPIFLRFIKRKMHFSKSQRRKQNILKNLSLCTAGKVNASTDKARICSIVDKYRQNTAAFR